MQVYTVEPGLFSVLRDYEGVLPKPVLSITSAYEMHSLLPC